MIIYIWPLTANKKQFRLHLIPYGTISYDLEIHFSFLSWATIWCLQVIHTLTSADFKWPLTYTLKWSPMFRDIHTQTRSIQIVLLEILFTRYSHFHPCWPPPKKKGCYFLVAYGTKLTTKKLTLSSIHYMFPSWDLICLQEPHTKCIHILHHCCNCYDLPHYLTGLLKKLIIC